MAPQLSLRQLGLCATCNYMELCTARKGWVGPIVHCENFEDSEPMERVARETLTLHPSRTAPARRHAPGTPHGGICVNCTARDYCGLRTPGAVVWYCEEYDVLPLTNLVPDSLLPPFAAPKPAAGMGLARKTPGKLTDVELVSAIVAKHQGSYGAVIAILEEIQSEYGYLPQDALVIAAEKTNRPLADIFGIATFYRAFSLKPRGKHRVSVCLGTACHVRGAPLIVGEFEQRLGVRPGETTADYEFTLEAVNCLGACALGPVVVADTKYFSKVKQSRVDRILTKVTSDNGAQLRSDPRVFPLALGCPHCGHSLLDSAHPIDDHPSVCLTASFDGRRCPVRLSSLYGSYAVECEHEVPLNGLVAFSCPHCDTDLSGARHCPDCDSPMLSLGVVPAGTLRICSRLGCKSHMLDLR